MRLASLAAPRLAVGMSRTAIERAIAQFGKVSVSGYLAWWLWLLVHILYLAGFRNRLVVLVDWAWNYFPYDRGLRAIVGEWRDGTQLYFDPSFGPVWKERLQALVPKSLDCHRNQCNVYGYRSQSG